MSKFFLSSQNRKSEQAIDGLITSEFYCNKAAKKKLFFLQNQVKNVVLGLF